MVPKLRFGEFSSPWDKLNLEVVSSYIKGFAFKSQDYADQGERIIRVSDLLSDSIKTQNEKIYISKLKVDDLKKYKIKSGEIIITTVGSKPELRDSAVGRAIFVREDGIGYLNQNLLKLTANKGFNSAFIYMSISGNRYLSHIENIQRGNANQSNITVSDLLEFPLFCPNEDEQLKLGLFLTAVDDKISQLTKKHELLTLYKKGVMQKIFNRELRFKDDEGREFAEWNKVSFADIANINMGQSPDSSTYNQDSLGLPLIQGNADIVDRKTSPRAWTSEPTKKCNPGDLIFTVRAPVGAIAKSSHTACIGRGVCAITPKENVCIEFLYQLLFWFESYKWKSIEQGSTFTAVSGEDIRNLKIMSPIFKEQTKIANFLLAIDDKITNVKSQLEAAKGYKQGLLQQMFI